jgi:acetyl esterase/lipase
MHIHGGGRTLGDERSNDELLPFYVDAAGLGMTSVVFRFALEGQFPCGVEDWFDFGEYL